MGLDKPLSNKGEQTIFKEFAMRGNVVDMAVGIIIGAAFGTMVKSLVADVIMPFRARHGMAVDFKAEMTIITSVNK